MLKLVMSRPKKQESISEPEDFDWESQGDKWDQGKAVIAEDGEQDEAPKRGTISSFSWRSRNRLLDVVNSIDQAAAPASRWRFITLTYHLQDVTPRETKAHVQAFLKRLDTFCGERVGAIWKLEPQKRGMPHHHLLVLLPESHQADVEAEREWFAKAWVDITNGTEEQYLVHRYAGARKDRRAAWQRLESWEHVAGYCGKYVGKVCSVPNEAAWASAGRWWGKVNADKLPIRIESHTFSQWESVRLQRLMRKAAVAKARQQGFNLVNNFEKVPLLNSTWASRKALRAQGVKLHHARPWIRGGLGGRLYILESESIRMMLFAQGVMIGWGKGDTPDKRVVGYVPVRVRKSPAIPYADLPF